MRYLLTFLLLVRAAFAAAGDIVSVTVGADGWYADVVVSGLSTGGTYAFGFGANNNPATGTPKMTLTATSLGYNDAGVATTTTRTIYGTKQIRKAYPDNAQNEESAGGGNVTVRVALSEPIYAKDKTGGGNSGTDPTYAILGGLYTQGGTPSNAGSGTVVNNSTLAYPVAFGNWKMVPYERMTGASFVARFEAWHHGGQDGRPVRMVRITATDESANSVSVDVTTPTYSPWISGEKAFLSYNATIPTTSLTQGQLITLKAIAFPWYGDASFDTSATGFTAPNANPANTIVFCDKNETYGITYVQVSGTGTATGTNGVQTTYNGGTILPYANINAALAAAASFNNSIRGRNDVGAVVCYLEDNASNYAWTGASAGVGTTPKTYCIIKKAPAATRSTVKIGASSGNVSVTDRVKFEDVTMVDPAGAGTINNCDFVWFHNCTFNNPTSLRPIFQAGGTGADVFVYFTGNTFIDVADNLTPFGTHRTYIALLHGNNFGSMNRLMFAYNVSANYRTGGGSASGFRFSYKTASSVTTRPAAPLVSFNDFKSVNSAGGSHILEMYNADAPPATYYGIAVVGNVFEQVASGASATVAIGFTPTAGDLHNVIAWNNTIAGGAWSGGYNDAGTAAVWRRNWSIKNNLFEDYNIKADVFSPESGNRIGCWPVLFGTSFSGNAMEKITSVGASGAANEFGGLNALWTSGESPERALTYYQFVDRKAYDGAAGAGNGNYHLSASSPAAGLQRDWLVPIDLDGTARTATSDAGAYAATSTDTANLSGALPGHGFGL